jgi:hypothetical protein
MGYEPLKYESDEFSILIREYVYTDEQNNPGRKYTHVLPGPDDITALVVYYDHVHRFKSHYEYIRIETYLTGVIFSNVTDKIKTKL